MIGVKDEIYDRLFKTWLGGGKYQLGDVVCFVEAGVKEFLHIHRRLMPFILLGFYLLQLLLRPCKRALHELLEFSSGSLVSTVSSNQFLIFA